MAEPDRDPPTGSRRSGLSYEAPCARRGHSRCGTAAAAWRLSARTSGALHGGVSASRFYWPERPTEPAAIAVEDRLYRWLAVLRVLLAANMVGLNLYRDGFSRP